MDWAEEASRSLRAKPMCLEEFDGGLEASQSLNPCLASNQSKTHPMHLSPSFRYPKTKWKRLARQLRHNLEQRLATQKRIAEAIQFGSSSKLKWMNKCIFEVSNVFNSTLHTELATSGTRENHELELPRA